MSKISIIIRREYLTRVRKRTFILSTFLFPIIMILFIVGSVLIAVKSEEVVRIGVPGDFSYLRSTLKSDSSSVIFIFDPAVNQNNFDARGYTGFLKPNHDSIFIMSRKQIGQAKDDIENLLNKA